MCGILKKTTSKRKLLSLPTFLYIGVALLCLCTFFGTVTTRTLARFTTVGGGEDSARVAGWAFNLTGASESETQMIDLSALVKPGTETVEIPIEISNFNGAAVCETAMEYDFIIETTANLPLVYTLQAGSTPSVGHSATVSAVTRPEGSDGTLSVIAKATGGHYPAAEKGTHRFVLTVSWPSDSEAPFELHEKIDLLLLTVNARQID